MKRMHLIELSIKSIKLYFIITILAVAVGIISITYKKDFVGVFKLIERTEKENDNGRAGRVAIVIDDFGFNGGGTKEMLELQIPITCAVLPFSENTREDSEKIHKQGHEIIVHIPMEPHHGDPKWLGEMGIRESLSTEKIDEIIRSAIKENPHAVGANNHMGSRATESRRIMETVIKVLKEKDMFILDSKTTMNSVVEDVARSYEVPYIGRSIFLDNVKDKAYIKKQIKKLGELALKEGSAVAIGHVGPEGGTVTAEAIKEMIPELEAMGVEFVYLSRLVRD